MEYPVEKFNFEEASALRKPHILVTFLPDKKNHLHLFHCFVHTIPTSE